jgi:putative spermidine/putrescine transport system substrate-binding protein
MLAAKAPHPNCAYKWMQYISTPQVQAQQAVTYGETPDNKLACSYMDKLQPGSCASSWCSTTSSPDCAACRVR